MSPLQRIFPGNSELARRMRALDWSTTELGPPERWPERLRSAVSICLLSRFPIVVWWGPNMSMLYNDPYSSFLGRSKHPAFLARSFKDAWTEIWPTIGPMLDGVRATREATWSEDTLLIFDRDLPKEEVYCTWSFSPLLGETDEVDGVFCAVFETTDKLVGSRRIDALHRLGVRASEAPTVDQACRASVEALAENPHDVPFAAIYLHERGATHLTLRASAGLRDLHALPRAVPIAADDEGSAWPLAAVLHGQRAADVELATLGLELPGGPWPEPANKAVVLPIFGSTRAEVIGVIVVGVSPRRVLDAGYRTFFDLVAGHVGKAITDAQAIEAERRRAEALAEIDRAKTTFFSNVSHEFRTPLALMLGPLEDTLANLSRLPTESIRDQLETVMRNALRLLKLVNALLDFSRIEAGRVQARFEPVDLAAFTAELAGVFRAAIERGGVELVVRCEPLPEPIHVDREMWEKIVLNLLSNAFKFTLEGEIEVVQRFVDDRVELTVRDTGIGIAASDLPRVFERFHRVDSGQARTYEGSGIGLSLVRELVRMHAGEIGVESEPGKGTRFTISIPRGVAHLPSERVGSEHGSTSTATRASAYVAEALRWTPEAPHGIADRPRAGSAVPDARILVVDDNADMREYLMRLLGERWVVDGAPDGGTALARMRETRFDLVLTDVMMPGLDGFALLRSLRTDPVHHATPVIMLSARAGEESRIEGLESGADDYLIKPFSGREVLARVETHLKLSTRRALAAENAALKLLNEVSARLISEDELPTLLDAVVDAALAVVGAPMGNVQLYDPESESLRIVAHQGFDQSFLDYFASVHDEAACGAARRLSARVIVEDVSRSPVFLGTPALAAVQAAGVRAVQSTPLTARDGRLLGMLSTHWTEPHRPDERTLRILDILTRAAADLIEHRQREEALRRSEATVRELRAAESASAERKIRGYQERIQEMAVDAMVREERERRRIAADLHDSVGQSLALSLIKLTAARQEIVGPSRDIIDQVIALIGESIASTRSLTFELSPPILYDLGLKEALSWFAEKLEKTHETHIAIADDGEDKPLDDVTAGLAFRATRELLMNVVKHSRAPTAKVSLRRVGDRLTITVEDDGVGFDQDDPRVRSAGIGLLGVREQIHRLRGSTEIISAPGRGARVVISFPLPSQS